MTIFAERYRLKLELQQQSGLYRNPPSIDKRQGKYLFSRGARLLNLASNDYLGLGSSSSLREKVAGNFSRYGTSSSSSRLVSGNFKLLNEAEKAYARYFGYEAALFFPSGYQANLGVLATLFESGDTILFDKHIHASSVKGMSLSGATARGFNHGDVSHLEKRLPKTAGPVAVVTESLFSMDGDCMDTLAWKALKEKYGFFCVVDEAHAFGVLGPEGRGLASGVADVAVGTFGKALGLFGAFALMPQQIKAFLLNFSSPQIYTTTLPEAHAASAFDVLEAIDRRESDRKSLMELSRWLKGQLRSSGFRVGGDAHILGVEIGDATSAVETARRLFSKGIFVLPARYPTVPLDKAILRVSLTTLHNQEDGAMFVEALKESYEASS
ncbi:MAG: aminotransferase class I/II-fold pyridoxal phosphate-dependent enzyme [Desulfobacteraceae bacterium]|jgi:8-amino-7-oxononanoate synthase